MSLDETNFMTEMGEVNASLLCLVLIRAAFE